MNDRPLYHHVQQGNALRVFMIVLGAALLIPAVLMLRGGDPAHVANILVASAGIVIVSGIIFSTLTIQVTASLPVKRREASGEGPGIRDFDLGSGCRAGT